VLLDEVAARPSRLGGSMPYRLAAFNAPTGRLESIVPLENTRQERAGPLSVSALKDDDGS
jgi:hypothetical protein